MKTDTARSAANTPLAGLYALLAAAAGLLFVACSQPELQAPPPPEVKVVTVKSQSLPNVMEVPGRLQAVRTAEVRARVDGIVERRLYDEGTDVRAGQALFRIDPRPLRAQLNSAEATLARAEATAANAEQDVTRYDGLVGRQAISQQEYDAAVARLRTAQADVAQATAQVEAASLNLSFATVTAPIAGRAGRAEVTEGALVSAGAATRLTTIEQMDPIFVNFSQANSQLLAIRRAFASREGGSSILVRLLLDDGTPYEGTGRLNFLDLSIDEATGTAALRAEIPNPDQLLLPGQFVRVQIEMEDTPDGMTVPQRAVTVTPQGGSVMVLADGDVAEARAVTLGELRGDAWIILDGLTTGGRVITDGLQKVQPGTPVRVAADVVIPADSTLSSARNDAGRAQP